MAGQGAGRGTVLGCEGSEVRVQRGRAQRGRRQHSAGEEGEKHEMRGRGVASWNWLEEGEGASVER